MENSIYTNLSKQLVLQQNMDLIANNIANMNTNGYRGQNMVFKEYLADQGSSDPLSMVESYGQYQVTKPGPIKTTGNPLDLALNGSGYFGVQTPDGIQYTRAGSFELNAIGELVTPAGYAVANTGGSTITIPQDAKAVKISPDGTVSTDQGTLGKLMIVEFADEQSLIPKGNNTYEAPNAGTPSAKTTVTQGALEGSNVDSILEITRMIDVSREFQTVQKTLQSEHERMRSAIQSLTKQG